MSAASIPAALGVERTRPPVRVRLDRVSMLCAALLAAETAVVLALSGTVRTALIAAVVTVMIVFALVFCLRAVTVSGFAAAAGAAGLVVLEPRSLLPVLGGAVLLAIVCGLAPGWVQVERWQAQVGTTAVSAAEATPRGPDRADRPRTRVRQLCANWRSDRVVAVLLVLVYPPLAAAGALWAITWMAGR